MKYGKITGLVAAAAMALMAFGAGTASATTLTSPTGTVYKGEVVASLEGTWVVREEGFGNVTCTEGVIKLTPNAQSDASTVTGSISTLTLGKPRAANEEESQCENGEATVNILKRGSFEFHVIPGTENATITWSGAVITVSKFGIDCIYSTSNTDIGTLTSSTVTGRTATMDINGIFIKASGSSFLCAEHATLESAYFITTPDTLWVS